MKNQILKFARGKQSEAFIVPLAAAAIFLLLLMSSANSVFATTSANKSKANLTIWDTTDSTTMYTYPTCREEHPNLDYQCPSKGMSSYNIYFYANFTNKTSGEIIESTREDGNCSIRFNENLTGAFTSWNNMTYSASTGQYQYNRSFKYKGNIPFEINCTNFTYGSVNASENTFISNTNPSIFAKNPGGKLPTRSITEDTVFYYNFSENCTDDDQNDLPLLTFNYLSGNTTLANFTFNTATGNLTVNISTNNDVGDGIKKIAFTCSDGGGIEDKAEMNFTVTAVNDAPIFLNLNSTMSATENTFFNFTLQASDEETNTPFYFNATFINCTTLNWSTRNSAKCNLFNLTQFGNNQTARIINFTPTNDDVGNYTIEFNVTDAGTPNSSRIKIVIFSVANTNDIPMFTSICGRTAPPYSGNATEDINFGCWVTANDTDEPSNLTFFTNLSWFTFNNSLQRFTENISGNSSSQINFTANDSVVGVWHINITINDTYGGMNSTVIHFNISNVDDSVVLAAANSTFESYMQAEFYLEMNASDDDLRIPIQGRVCDYGCYNESLNFSREITGLTAGGNNPGTNTTLFRIIKNATSGNTTSAYLKFTPSQSDAGNYTVNITVWDRNNYSISSRVFNISIFANTVPYWNSPLETEFTMNEFTPAQTFTLNLNANATDDDSDAITFSDNTGLFAISSSGAFTITSDKANDSGLGTYSAIITLTDARGAVNSSKMFTFNIKNSNETPRLYLIANQSVSEDSALSMTMYANDEDLSMNVSASGFYSENINWSINSTTPWFTSGKLHFAVTDNKTAAISFTPNKTDVGVHTVNITLNDSTGRMDSQEFTITVGGVNHAPYFTYIGSPINVTLNSSNNYTCLECIDINVTDVEDGNDNTFNLNLTFVSNETWFKVQNGTGKVNFTVGRNKIRANGWWVNLTVYDTGINSANNVSNSTLFRIVVYEYNVPPAIDRFAPTIELQYNMEENSTALFQAIVSDENAHLPNNDILNVTWRVDGAINKTETASNNSSPWWRYNTTFLSETTNTTAHNITLWAYDSANNFSIVSWNVSVNHTNSPPKFTGTISNITMSDTSSVTVTCDLSSDSGMCTTGGTAVSAGGYFSDEDHTDARYNHSINLSIGVMQSDCITKKNSPAITTTLNSNTVSAIFYTTATIAECFNITAVDFQNATYNVTSNKFIVNLTVNSPASVPVPTSGGGGGGGDTRKTPIALKIVMPEPMTMYAKDRIIVPISVLNNGTIDLYGITLTVSSLPDGMNASLSRSKFDKLASKQKETFEMTLVTNTNTTGTYEVILTGTSRTPSYTDSASFFVNLVELGYKEKIKAQEKIVFLQELLLGNPECLELQEVLKQAKKELDSGNYAKALQLSEAAVQACKYAIASKGKTVEIKKKFRVQDFVLPAFEGLFVFLLLYLIYHYTQRKMIMKRR
ncbi:MAG: hypothetical protein V1886_01720 [archaeon]